jgi:hypothetical protein
VHRRERADVDVSSTLAGVVVGGVLGYGGTTLNQALQAQNDRHKEHRADERARAARLRAAYATVLESHAHLLLLARTSPPEERMVAEIQTLGALSATLTLEPDRFVPDSHTAIVAVRLADLVMAVQAYYGVRPDGTLRTQEATQQTRDEGWDQLVEAMNAHLAQLEGERDGAGEDRPWWRFWRR